MITTSYASSITIDEKLSIRPYDRRTAFRTALLSERKYLTLAEIRKHWRASKAIADTEKMAHATISRGVRRVANDQTFFLDVSRVGRNDGWQDLAQEALTRMLAAEKLKATLSVPKAVYDAALEMNRDQGGVTALRRAKGSIKITVHDVDNVDIESDGDIQHAHDQEYCKWLLERLNENQRHAVMKRYAQLFMDEDIRLDSTERNHLASARLVIEEVLKAREARSQGPMGPHMYASIDVREPLENIRRVAPPSWVDSYLSLPIGLDPDEEPTPAEWAHENATPVRLGRWQSAFTSEPEEGEYTNSNRSPADLDDIHQKTQRPRGKSRGMRAREFWEDLRAAQTTGKAPLQQWARLHALASMLKPEKLNAETYAQLEQAYDLFKQRNKAEQTEQDAAG